MGLIEIMEEQRRLRKDLIPWVFHWKGKPFTCFYTQWARACKQAGVAGKLFHDLRRTTVRNMTRAKVLRPIATKVSGHKSDSVYDCSDIVDEEDIREGLLTIQHYLSQHESKIYALSQNDRISPGTHASRTG